MGARGMSAYAAPLADETLTADAALDDVSTRLERLCADAEALIEQARGLQEQAREIQSLVAEARVERNHRRAHMGLPQIERRLVSR